MYNQSQFPVDRPLLQPMQYDPNRPPFVPQIQVNPWMQPYLPYLTGILMDMITKGAVGPLSMHFYNHMSHNQWQNEDFVKEVHNCADFVFLKTAAIGQNIDPGNAIIRMAPAYLSLRSIYEAKLFNLMHYIDVADQNGIYAQHIQFEQEMAQIIGLRNGAMPGASPGVSVPVGMPMAAGRYPQMGGVMQPTMQMAAPAPAMAAPGYGVPMGAAPVGQAGRGPGGGRDYANSATPVQTPAPAPAPVMQAAPAPAPAPTAAPVNNDAIVEASQAGWRGADSMPYPMAYNPVLVKMMYKIENGKTLPYPTKNESINMIDYDRHQIGTLFGQPPENLPVVKDNGQIVRNLAAAVQDAAAEELEVDSNDERLKQNLGLKAILSAPTLDIAIQDGEIEMLSVIDRDNPPMVFQVYAQIFTPFITEKSEYALLQKFADSSSYIELREKVRSAGDSAPPKLITEVNLRLTALMNNLLRNSVSIMPNELTVDDFVQDLDPLLSSLKNSYGDKVQKAFLKNQGKRIKALFGMPDVSSEQGKKLHDVLSENALTMGWEGRDNPPQFTFFGSTVRLTYLNVISHDLLLSGLTQVGNILTKQQMPALFDLAHQVFSADDAAQNVARQLVITKDGRIIELFEATLVEGGYLVGLVK